MRFLPLVLVAWVLLAAVDPLEALKRTSLREGPSETARKLTAKESAQDHKGSKSSSSSKGKSKESRSQSKSHSRSSSSSESNNEPCLEPTPKDVCVAPEEPVAPTVVSCGVEIVDQVVTLKSGLACPTPNTNEAVITVNGPQAVLDCAGDGDNMIVDRTFGNIFESGSIGVVLLNGATMKNCFVQGFGTGVVMRGDGNNRIVGSTILGNQVGVMSDMTGSGQSGDRAYSVEGSTIMSPSGSDTAGVLTQHDGSMTISNTDILGGQSTVGVHAVPMSGNGLNLAMEDVNIFRGEQGVVVGDDSTDYGQVVLDLFGRNKLIGNQGKSILVKENTNEGGSITVFGDLIVEYAGDDPIEVMDADATFVLEAESRSEIINTATNSDQAQACRGVDVP